MPTINFVSWNSRTNIISIKSVNHNGWNDIFVIKKTTFLFIVLTYLAVFLLKFWSGELFGCGIWFIIQRLPTLHTFDGPRYPKNKKYLKNVMMTSSSHFSGISCFWGSGVRQKYVEWVLVGCGILIPHPMISPNRNLNKNTGRYVENTNKK